MGTYVARFLKQYPLIAYTLRFRVRLWARPYKPFLNLLHTNTHTHTHTHTHTYPFKCTHTCTHKHIQMRAHTDTQRQ